MSAEGKKRKMLKLTRLLPNVFFSGTFLFVLAFMLIFLDTFQGLYNFIGIGNQNTPNFELLIYSASMVLLFFLCVINFIYYFKYSSVKNAHFVRSSLKSQIIANVAFIVGVIICMIAIIVWANILLNALVSDGVINNVNVNLIYLPIGICILLILILSFLQVCIFTPENRRSPVWKSTFIDQDDV
ncbi:MAG: hypothetical protein FWB80_00705 [Defluviitaleaceae bacterium]|nr:hypothetical protein [Defluviitaleaceae bacterium]